MLKKTINLNTLLGMMIMMRLDHYVKSFLKISSLMNKDFDSEPIYGASDNYIKMKIKSCGDKVKRKFHSKKTPKENASCKCLSLIMLNFVIKVNKKYYL